MQLYRRKFVIMYGSAHVSRNIGWLSVVKDQGNIYTPCLTSISQFYNAVKPVKYRQFTFLQTYFEHLNFICLLLNDRSYKETYRELWSYLHLCTQLCLHTHIHIYIIHTFVWAALFHKHTQLHLCIKRYIYLTKADAYLKMLR